MGYNVGKLGLKLCDFSSVVDRPCFIVDCWKPGRRILQFELCGGFLIVASWFPALVCYVSMVSCTACLVAVFFLLNDLIHQL